MSANTVLIGQGFAQEPARFGFGRVGREAASLSMPTGNARSVQSSSRSISKSPKVRVSGCPQRLPDRSARSILLARLTIRLVAELRLHEAIDRAADGRARDRLRRG
jgi:hypothetical protein